MNAPVLHLGNARHDLPMKCITCAAVSEENYQCVCQKQKNVAALERMLRVS